MFYLLNIQLKEELVKIKSEGGNNEWNEEKQKQAENKLVVIKMIAKLDFRWETR